MFACNSEKNYQVMSSSMVNASIGDKTDTATFGTGCFWCTEAIFEDLKGVLLTRRSQRLSAAPTMKRPSLK